MRMGENTRAIGNLNEDLAVEYLKQNGYEIVARNWVCKKGYEIDIIAKKGEYLAIVEVKSHSVMYDYFTPAQKVNRDKQRRIKYATRAFAGVYGEDYYYRFDIIEIVAGEIDHIKDAYR